MTVLPWEILGSTTRLQGFWDGTSVASQTYLSKKEEVETEQANNLLSD